MSQTVEKQLEEMLRQLNRKTLVRWLEGMRLGQVAYDYLLSAVRDLPLTKHQRANALIAIYRLRGYGEDEDLLLLLVQHAAHTDIRVRGQAISLLVGLMRLHDFKPPYMTGHSITAVREGLSLGLHQDGERVARKFLEMAERSES